MRSAPLIRSGIFTAGAAALLAVLLVQVGPAQQGKAKGAKAAAKKAAIPPGDWPLYSRDLASDRFSPLNQINTTNVAQLKQAWTYRPQAPPPPPDNEKGGGKGKGKGGAGGIGGEVTPIVVNGVMYVPAGSRVMALDAESGKQIWTYTAPGAVGNRAVGYWPGEGSNPPRVLFTAGTKMMALNANTGAIDPGFGKEGTVDIGITWGGAPYVYKNLVILGNNNGESTDGPAGNTKVYDARTGSKLWDFNTIAQPGDPGHETWLNDGWKKRAGVNTWGWYFTVDEDRDLIYMP
ncbi:MAG TPA: PQQ-binding-like beta-propeller repeat protein, partial [Bryobacteraceae bacterium]